MEIRQLVTFIRASQFQSFSKAAESLGYSQSAVTVQIRALEESGVDRDELDLHGPLAQAAFCTHSDRL